MAWSAHRTEVELQWGLLNREASVAVESELIPQWLIAVRQRALWLIAQSLLATGACIEEGGGARQHLPRRCHFAGCVNSKDGLLLWVRRWLTAGTTQPLAREAMAESVREAARAHIKTAAATTGTGCGLGLARRSSAGWLARLLTSSEQTFKVIGWHFAARPAAAQTAGSRLECGSSTEQVSQ